MPGLLKPVTTIGTGNLSTYLATSVKFIVACARTGPAAGHAARSIEFFMLESF
jgi:hypothetical protein